MRQHTAMAIKKPKKKAGTDFIGGWLTHASRLSSQLVARGLAVLVERLHRLKRILIHVFADQRQLLDDVVGNRDHLTANLVSLEDVEELARARPDQLGIRRGTQPRHRLGHDR